MGRRIDAAVHTAWRRRWERFEGSSVTVAEFCRREGVSQAAFYQWRKRLTREATSAEQAATGGTAAAQGTGGGRGRRPETRLWNWRGPPRRWSRWNCPTACGCACPPDREPALSAAIRAAGELASLRRPWREEAAAC